MKASEFSSIAAILGLSNPAYADALGVDVRRVRAYSSGARPVPKTVALAVWAVVMQPRVARLVPGFLGS